MTDAGDGQALRLARAHLEAGRPLDALGIAAPWLSSHPDDADGLVVVGRCLLDADRPGDAVEARRLASRAVVLSPDDPEGWWLAARTARSRQATLHGARRLRELAPAEPWALRAFCDLALGAGAVAEAEEAAVASLRIDPDHPGSHTALGDVRAVQRRREEAADHYRAALAIDPESRDARRALASLLARGRDAESSVAELARLRGADPDDSTTEAHLEAAAGTVLARLAAIALLSCIALLAAAPLADGLFGLSAPGVPLRPAIGVALQLLLLALGTAAGVLAVRRLERRVGSLARRVLRSRFGDGPFITLALGFAGASAPLAVAGVVVGGTAGDPYGTILLVMAADSALTAVVLAGFLGTVVGSTVRRGYALAAVAVVLVAPGFLMAAVVAFAGFVPFAVGFVITDLVRRSRREKLLAREASS